MFCRLPKAFAGKVSMGSPVQGTVNVVARMFDKFLWWGCDEVWLCFYLKDSADIVSAVYVGFYPDVHAYGR